MGSIRCVKEAVLKWCISRRTGWGPRMTNGVPEVDRVSLGSPARPAAVKRPRFKPASSSPTKPNRLQFLVALTHRTIRRSFLSQCESHFVIFVVKTTNARSRSKRPNRAMYIIFMRHLADTKGEYALGAPAWLCLEHVLCLVCSSMTLAAVPFGCTRLHGEHPSFLRRSR